MCFYVCATIFRTEAMSANPEIVKYAKDFLDKLTRKGIKVKHAKLFGSYAKKASNNFSDIDILLVADEFVGVGFIDYKLITDELIKFDMIHLISYSTSDYEEGDPFVEEVNTTGIDLISN